MEDDEVDRLLTKALDCMSCTVRLTVDIPMEWAIAVAYEGMRCDADVVGWRRIQAEYGSINEIDKNLATSKRHYLEARLSQILADDAIERLVRLKREQQV